MDVGADVGLPHVAFRVLRQPDVGAQQRMHRQRLPALPVDLVRVAGEHQRDVGPGRQRCVDEAPAGVQGGEIDRGARAVQISQEAAQAVGHLLLAPQRRQGGQGDVEAACGLVDGVGQQRVRRQLAEDPVTVLERGLHRRGEPHGVAEVVHPVVGVEEGLVARVVQGRGVVRNRRLHWVDVLERLGQLVEDRIDLGRVGRDVDGDLTGHHTALLPRRHQLADRLGGAADDRRLRRGDHRQHDVVDPASGEL